jgi:XTP/dITP diphosphohydrolase
MKLVIATHNKDKLVEIKGMLKDLDVEIISALDYPEMPETIEDKDTIKGNAEKKAQECADFTGLLTIADDTGLFVDALDGNPGVYAARYAGEDCSYKDNRDKMLKEMKGKDNRTAYFRTVAALAVPGKIVGTANGEVKGSITSKDIGTDGFGYDPIFRAVETGRTFGEMTLAEKEKISHRARAFRNIIPILKENINK